MVHLTPGDPVVIFAMGKPLSEEREAQIREQYRARSAALGAVPRLHGGPAARGSGKRSARSSARSGTPSRKRSGRPCNSTVAGLFVALALGVTLGILAALFHNTWLDSAAMVVALLGVSTPVFYLGLLLLFAFSFHFHLFPATGTGGWQNLVLPALTVGFASAAYIARLVRSSMLEVLRQDYVTTARAKGVSGALVVTRHALKNALIPVVTYFGIQLAGPAHRRGGDRAGLFAARVWDGSRSPPSATAIFH